MTALSLSSFRWAFLVLLGILTFSPAQANAGMTQDEVKAFEGYKQKAEKGDAEAQYNLAVSYYDGTGSERDYVLAAAWYRKAAEQGHAMAQCVLGWSYHRGQLGVKRDLAEALAYYSLAARTNDRARKDLALLEGETSPDVRKAGYERAKELQKEIEAKMAAKKGGK